MRKFSIITGISRGLGFALASRLLERQFSVIGIGRTDSELLKKTASQQGLEYHFLKLDLADVTSQSGLLLNLLSEINFAEVEEIHFIHNAAVTTPVGKIKMLSSEEITIGIHTNLTSSIILSQLVISVFLKLKIPLRIIHISSGAALRPIPGSNIYCIAKAGMEMLVRGIHSEVILDNQKIECIGFRPGMIDTAMQQEIRSQSIEDLPVVEMYKNAYNNGLLRQPEIVANLLVEKLILQPIESGQIYSIEDFVK